MRSVPIKSILKVKELSDQGRYAEKTDLLRQLIQTDPVGWYIDSRGPGGIVGLTHRSGFRVHMPAQFLPTTLNTQKGVASVKGKTHAGIQQQESPKVDSTPSRVSTPSSSSGGTKRLRDLPE